MKKICVVTATRAEYGLLKPLMDLIKRSDRMLLQIIATGTHLSSEFGFTYKQIEADGFLIDEKLEILLSSDTATGIVKTMSLALNGMADILPRVKPDMLVLLGDRYEMLAIASAATMFKIPIVHIHGGEITEGAYDDAIRHALTKLSHLHFTSTQEYRNRVIQMGENPNSVFNVGAIGLDNIKNLNLLTRGELETELNIRFKKYNYQITFHPETLEQVSSAEQFKILLDAIDQQEDSFFVFTKANADTDGRVINQMIDKYVADHPSKAAAYASLGTLRFLSLVRVCTAIVGNSSSGILEAPSLKTATINIGDRQLGRLQATSVVNVSCEEQEILNAFEVIKTYSFQENLDNIVSPYENGGAAQQILAVIDSHLDQKAVKKFLQFNMSIVEKHTIHQDLSIREALIKLDLISPSSILFVVDEKNLLLGSLTDGDLRRGFIRGLDFENNLLDFVQPNPVFIREREYDLNKLDQFRKDHLKIIPIVNGEKQIIDILDFSQRKTLIPADAVLMAGGEGKRLRPLTEKTPKPLLLVGEKPIIEYNIDRLKEVGVHTINISINYLGDQLEQYFGDGSQKDIRINYVRETKPLGTIGSVLLVEDFDHEDIIIMNSDLLTNIDFNDFFKTYQEANADMIVATTSYHVDVPYAVLEVNENNAVKSLKEKPRYTYYSNAGIYILKKNLLSMIPQDKFFDITDLMDRIIEMDLKLVTYPINGYWLDIGKHEDFKKAQEDIKHIKF